MTQWVRLCGVAEAPAEGAVMEAEAAGVAVCLARVGGELTALDNWCPHRRGPLGQGWVENGLVVCPWHSWQFDPKTGAAEYPEGERVAVFPVRVEADEVLIEVETADDPPVVTEAHESGSD
jgi:nitrite reductase (NADH) small subunit